MGIERSRGYVTDAVPIGTIVMWSGTIATIPTTWALCDGTLNSPGPDLRDKFIVGAKQDDSGVAKTNLTGSLTASGSAAVSAHSLTTNVAIANHTLSTDVALSAHTLTTNVAIANHSLSTGSARTSNASTLAAVTTTAPTHTITQPVVGNHTITQPVVNAHTITQPVVANHTSNWPTYYALAFIQKMSVAAGEVVVRTINEEVAYAAFTSDATITSTSFPAELVVAAPAFTADGTSSYMVEFFSPYITNSSSGGQVQVALYLDGAEVGVLDFGAFPSGISRSIRPSLRVTPAAGSRTYSVRAAVNTGTGTIAGRTGGTDVVQGYIRITKINPTNSNLIETGIWQAEINPLLDRTSIQGTWEVITTDAEFMGYMRQVYPGVPLVNDELNWNIYLSRGTWDMWLLTVTGNDRAIKTFSLDGSSIGTLDGYSGSTTFNVAQHITGFSVATSGTKVLSAKSASKNGSSSGYFMDFAWITFKRTA